jgi:hypothetical protein
MAWNTLATQFCLELALGVDLGLCLLARAPLGTFFFRLMGTTAFVPTLAALVAPILFGGGSLRDPTALACLAAALAWPLASGPVSVRTRTAAQLWCTGTVALALFLTVRAAPGIEGTAGVLLGTLSAMATGTVAGGVGLAMVLGHWYLTVPELPIAWLARLNRFTALAMAVSLALLATSCVLFREELSLARSPLLGAWGMLQLGARVSTGLALPLLFAWMTAGSLAWRNTRSATGILYASTVLVLIGTAVSISLQHSYGIPL